MYQHAPHNLHLPDVKQHHTTYRQGASAHQQNSTARTACWTCQPEWVQHRASSNLYKSHDPQSSLQSIGLYMWNGCRHLFVSCHWCVCSSCYPCCCWHMCEMCSWVCIVESLCVVCICVHALSYEHCQYALVVQGSSLVLLPSADQLTFSQYATLPSHK